MYYILWVLNVALEVVSSTSAYWYQNIPGPYTHGYDPWESVIYVVPVPEEPIKEENLQGYRESNTEQNFLSGTYPGQEFSVLTPYPKLNAPAERVFSQHAIDLTQVYNSDPLGIYAQAMFKNLYGTPMNSDIFSGELLDNTENFQGRFVGNLDNYLEKLTGNKANYQRNLLGINNPNFNKIINGFKTNLQDPDGPQSKILPKLFTPMIVFKRPKTKMQMKNATCKAKGGMLLDNECYEYITMMLNFDAARTHCMQKGGDLWTPNFDDIKLFKKLLTTFPKVAGAPHNSVWIGAKKLANLMTVHSVNGTDITSTIFIGIDAFSPITVTPAQMCILYSFAFGYQLAEDDVCTMPYQFICEYPTEKPKQNSTLVFFNKFNLFNKW